MFIKYWDNALNEEELLMVDEELSNLNWTKLFTRAGSHMLECNDLKTCPALNTLYNKFTSSDFLNFLETETNIKGLLPDPHFIGAGYSQIKDSGDLKPHIDFNWNEKIKMYRAASYIIYLSTPEEGGEIEFIDTVTIKPQRNRAVLFEHSETIRHFVHPVKGTRNAVRFFYYTSNLQSPENYHRSLYGVRDGVPTDV